MTKLLKGFSKTRPDWALVASSQALAEIASTLGTSSPLGGQEVAREPLRSRSSADFNSRPSSALSLSPKPLCELTLSKPSCPCNSTQRFDDCPPLEAVWVIE